MSETTHYDAIIIGAGLSGIAAAIRLAHYDRNVLLVERHHLPGGLNSFYRYHGRLVDAGLHAVTNFAPPRERQAPLNRLLRQLRISRESLELCEQGHSSICFPDATLHFSNDPADLEAGIAERFPSQVDGFRALVAAINEQNPFALDAAPGSAMDLLGRHISDPLLQDMILCPVMFYGNPMPRAMDLNHFCVMFRSLFREGLARPRQGMRHVLSVLLERLRDAGAESRFNCGVRSLAISDGRVATVRLDNGECLHAKQVFSCAGYSETLDLCQPRPGSAAAAKAGEMTFAETVFFLDRPAAELGIHDSIRFLNHASRFTYAPPETPLDLKSAVLCAPGNFSGCGDTYADNQVRITHMADYHTWLELDPDAYGQAKQDSVAAQVNYLELAHPGFRDAVVDWDMFTPRTIRRFTGHLNGTVYGSPEKHRDGRTPLENLFICGTDQGFLGIVGSLLSGISMANLHGLS